MKRKIISVLAIAIFILNIASLKVHADTEVCNISLSPKISSVEPGGTIDIAINISNITDTDGLAAYSATIGFNNDIFTYSKIVGSGEWETPIYNEGNIAATVTTGVGQTTNQTIAVLTLKVNSDVEDGDYEVSLSDIKVSNGTTLTISPVKTTITVAKATNDDNSADVDTDKDNSGTTSGNEDKTTAETQTGTTSGNEDKTTAETQTGTSTSTISTITTLNALPYAGAMTKVVLPFGILLIGVVGVVAYLGYRKYIGIK